MLRRLAALLLPLLLLVGSAAAVTLEKLSLEELIDSSTLIVRGTIGESTSSNNGQRIETDYRVKVSEVLKEEAGASAGGSGSGSIAVSLPGGAAGGMQQTLAGVPVLERGAEYVLFLWRARSGRLLLVGMSQGLLRIEGKGSRASAIRPAIDGTMLDRNTGRAVRDSGLGMRLAALREVVTRRAATTKGGRQ